eukprot:SAG11_NODE_21411_length_425_cov_1.269939_1_plen_109_part_10
MTSGGRGCGGRVQRSMIFGCNGRHWPHLLHLMLLHLLLLHLLLLHLLLLHLLLLRPISSIALISTVSLLPLLLPSLRCCIGSPCLSLYRSGLLLWLLWLWLWRLWLLWL